jgi:hypothetical protein
VYACRARGCVSFVLSFATLLTLLSSARVSNAQPRFEAGGRLGYAVPFGEVERGTAVSDLLVGRVPLWVDLGVRLTDAISFGTYLEVGLGIPGASLDRECARYEEVGTACDAETGTLRIGVQGQFHFAPGAKLDPWVGASFGYEWTAFELELEESSGDTSDLTQGAHGLEFIGLQGGLDFRISSRAGVGPFTALTLGRYQAYVVECEGECGVLPRTGGDISEPSLHAALVLGVRVVVLP